LYLQACPLTRGESFATAGHAPGRVVGQDIIERRVEALLDRVPVTRVSDISRLDRSAMPVFSATTPLARDLTTHLGKGLSARAARVSAIMEAIERVSGETVPGELRLASRAQLVGGGVACVDPEGFDLPPSTGYRPDRPIAWVKGWDLVAQGDCWLPADLCKTPPDQGVLDQVDTNGLASGASHGEAIRHALLEVIERDAVSQQLFFDLFGAEGQKGPARLRIDLDSLPQACAGYLRQYQRPGLRVVLDDITTDIGVPVAACWLIDEAYPAADGPVRMIFGGWGCEVSMEAAVNRALSEAHQSRIGALQGTRDSFNILQGSERAFTKAMREGVLDAGVRGAQKVDATDRFGDLAEDVDWIVGRLRGAGIDQAVVADMTSPDLGIPVVRVRVPGLSVFVVDRQRVGWRCMRHVL